MAGVLDANPSRPTRSIHMAVIISEMSMSLDGFVADPADQVGPLFDWYANGEVEVPTAVPERWTFRTSEASAGYLRETMGRIGALVAGRRLFDIGRWGEHGHPYGVPVFVVTHDVPQGWPRVAGKTPGRSLAGARAAGSGGRGRLGRRRLGAAVLGRGLGRRGCRRGGLRLVAGLGRSRLRFAGHQALRLVRLVGQAAPDLLDLASCRPHRSAAAPPGCPGMPASPPRSAGSAHDQPWSRTRIRRRGRPASLT